MSIKDGIIGAMIVGGGENGGGPGPSAGVSSFNGRTGAVRPQAGDYTAAQVGAVQAPGTAGTEGQVLTTGEDGTTEWADVPSDLPDGGTVGQVLTKTADGSEWANAPGGLPEGGNAGQVLTKTETGAEWDDVPSDLPPGGTTGQILVKTEDGVGWETAPATGVTTFNGRSGAVVPQNGDYTAEMVGAVAATSVGTANGVAELDENGLVPASQLPGFVDDVVDAYVVGSTPYAADWLSLTDGGAALTPAASTIYLVVSAGDYQNQQYRWSGTQYAAISSGLTLGETEYTAYRGDRGKIAYDHSQITGANPHGVTATMIGAADATTTSQALQALSDEVDGIISGTSPITLPVASEAKVGGVKVGEGLSITEDGTLSATGGGGGGTSGVSSFNGRTGEVTPQEGDYTAAQVGARASTWMPTAGNGLQNSGDTMSVNVSTEADNATGILNGALYTSIPRPSAVYPLVEVTTVPASASIQVTATKGELSVQGTTDENGKVDIELSAFGVWTFTATIDGEQAIADVAVNASQLYTLNLSPYKVYGAEWDGSSAPEWSRTDDAELFEDPSPAVNNGTGSSPFDNILPWSGMEIEEDPTAGTLVRIPKYYYKWTRTDAAMKLQICMDQLEGFLVSPAHADRGDGQGERDYVYVGRYHCASTYKSTTGVQPISNITRATARTNIHALSNDIWQYDFAMYWTIMMLYLVEYADWNSQAVIGYGCSPSGSIFNMGLTDDMEYHTGTSAATRETYGCCQYRHIEGLWDDGFDWIDGIYLVSGEAFCIKNPADFSDNDGGTSVGQFANGSSAGTYITAWTTSEAPGFEYALVPSEASGGSSSTYICDVLYYRNTSQVLDVGAGATTQTQSFGMFTFHADNAASYSSGNIVCRLQKLPISA